MYFFGYDDMELLYLINDGNEWALNVVIEKYQPMIMKTIRTFNIDLDKDDIVQEANLILLKAIRTYTHIYGKTFYRYFEFILIRDLVRIARKNQQFTVEYELYQIKDNNVDVLKECVLEYSKERLVNELKTKIERDVYYAYYIKGLNIEIISTKYGYARKQIYNAINRIKLRIGNLD